MTVIRVMDCPFHLRRPGTCNSELLLLLLLEVAPLLGLAPLGALLSESGDDDDDADEGDDGDPGGAGVAEGVLYGSMIGSGVLGPSLMSTLEP